ncbi:type II toxin-antitoxin system HigB family toxin [Dyadobacter chenwenxiniae]|uniref:type II toxin-antitoxin system HigB family toxin n=1 Tax=Dyadobacter chenwenxiniae TaxID=2906456 RepID=UPI0035B6590C
MIARINFEHKRIMIKWIGTHAEYDMRDIDIELKLIETEEEYDNAIARIDLIFDAPKRQ